MYFSWKLHFQISLVVYWDSPKRRFTKEKFIYQQTKTPNIDFSTLLLLFEYLWRHVLFSATDCLPLLQSAGPYFSGKTKVADLRVIILVNKNILRLDIAMQDIVWVYIVDSLGDLKYKLDLLIFR